MPTEENEKVRENRVRRMAERQGLALQKCRRRDELARGYGTYRLVDPFHNRVVASVPALGDYGLDLDDVEDFLYESGEPRRPTLQEAAQRRNRANAYIPGGPWPQGRWKNAVLLSHANFGMPIGRAVEDATASERALDPTFEPRFDPALLDIGESSEDTH
jgi:hypothetical protein